MRNASFDVRCWEDCDVPAVVSGMPLMLTGLGSLAEFVIAVLGVVIGIVGVSLGAARRRGMSRPALAFSAVATLLFLAALSAAAHSPSPHG